MEDDWGSVWEEVIEESELLKDAILDKSKQTNEVLAAGEGEILEEGVHGSPKKVEGLDLEEQFIELVEQAVEPIMKLVEENRNEIGEVVEEVKEVEEQFVESVDEPIGRSVEEADGQAEELVEEVENEKSLEVVERVDNEKEDMVVGGGEEVFDVLEKVINENETLVGEMTDLNADNTDGVDDLTDADENFNSVNAPAVDKVSKERVVEKVKIGRSKNQIPTRRAVWVGRKRGPRVKGASGFWKVIDRSCD